MNNTSSAADKAVLESLPSSLRSAVLQDIHLCTLSATSTFGEMEAEALKRVCAIVKSVLYLPEEVICLQGDVVTEMCALEHGCILSLSSRALTEAEAASREAEASNSAKARWKGAVSATISSVGSRNRVLPEDFGEAEAESASIKTGERRLPQKRGSILMWRQTVAAVVRVVRRKKDCDVAGEPVPPSPYPLPSPSLASILPPPSSLPSALHQPPSLSPFAFNLSPLTTCGRPAFS